MAQRDRGAHLPSRHHAVLARLRFIPGIRRFIDPPLKVLIRNGHVDRRNLRRCGLTIADLEAVLRQHGHESSDRIHLAIFEAKGAISILLKDGRVTDPNAAAPATLAGRECE